MILTAFFNFKYIFYIYIYTHIHINLCGYIGYGDLRISGGSYSGKLEFRSNNTWGYVCSSGFNDAAALVACRQLGYNDGYYYTDHSVG